MDENKTMILLVAIVAVVAIVVMIGQGNDGVAGNELTGNVIKSSTTRNLAGQSYNALLSASKEEKAVVATLTRYYESTQNLRYQWVRQNSLAIDPDLREAIAKIQARGTKVLGLVNEVRSVKDTARGSLITTKYSEIELTRSAIAVKTRKGSSYAVII